MQIISTNSINSQMCIRDSYYSIDENTFIVDKVLKNSPAEEADVQAKDQIYAVNGTVCQNMKLDDIEKLIKGKEGSDVEIELIRDGKHITKTMARRAVSGTVLDVYKRQA